MEVTHHKFSIPNLPGAGAAAAVASVETTGCDLERLQDAWLVGEERERFARFKVLHARADFLAGRIAAKTALRELDPSVSGSGCEIVRGIWHQPCVRGAGSAFTVTLAHASGQAVAVAFDSRWKCGIDIEGSSREAADVVASQVSPPETAWARAGKDEETRRWMLLWTAREALGKALGTGLLFPAALLATKQWTCADEKWSAEFADDGLLGVRSVTTPNCVLSWVLPREAARSPEIEAALDFLAARLRREPPPSASA